MVVHAMRGHLLDSLGHYNTKEQELTAHVQGIIWVKQLTLESDVNRKHAEQGMGLMAKVVSPVQLILTKP